MARERFCFVEEAKPVLQWGLQNRDWPAVGRVAVQAVRLIESNEMNCKPVEKAGHLLLGVRVEV